MGETRPERGARDASPPLLNGEGAYREDEGGDTLPTDMSDTSDSEPDKHHNPGESEKCTSPHDGKLLMRQQFPFNIDQMFTMIFTNSKFNLELLAARGTADYVQAPWQPQGGLKCRQCKYRLSLTSGPIGPKEVHVTETQVMNKCSKPGYLYSIDTVSENAGIPYADYFTVAVHYCLHKAPHGTELQVFGQLRYKKTMWPMVKSFLEKNTMSGLEDYCRLIETRLAAEAQGGAGALRKRPRPRRPTVSSQESGTALPALKLPATALAAPRAAPARSSGSGWLAGVLVLLLLLNALLYWRLYHADRGTYQLDDLQNRMSSLSGAQMADWSKLLQQHTLRQRGQLLAWRDALDRTVALLAQTEQALKKLLETIKPSLERAQHDAPSDTTRDDL